MLGEGLEEIYDYLVFLVGKESVIPLIHDQFPDKGFQFREVGDHPISGISILLG